MSLPQDERSPLLGSWSRTYAAVLVWLALQIALLFVFTRMFNR